MEVRHLHSSGRFDRSEKSVHRAMRRYAEHHNIITTTEAQRRTHRRALVMAGWTVVQFDGDGPGDGAILVKDEDWDILGTWPKRLSKYEQRRGPGGPPSPHSTTALLKSKTTGKRLLVSVSHLPSHVEGDWFDRFYWRVFVWRDSQKHWREHINHLRRLHHGAKVMYVADWNLNFKRRVFRVLVRTLHPKLHITWHKPFPRGGTHGDRIIDATLTNLKVVRKARLFEDDNSSDHRPYDEVLDW